ncbi:hypothetical protein D3C71_2112460 [compost metagenome]
MHRRTVCLQVTGLAHALPQLLPLAGASLGGQFAAQFEQLLGRGLAGVQRMKGKGGQQ